MKGIGGNSQILEKENGLKCCKKYSATNASIVHYLSINSECDWWLKHVICLVSLSESQIGGDQGLGRVNDTSACTIVEAAKYTYHILGNYRIKIWKAKSLAKSKSDQNGSHLLTLLWMGQEAGISILFISPGKATWLNSLRRALPVSWTCFVWVSWSCLQRTDDASSLLFLIPTTS